ncbi:MAG: diguanylate cyclase/phosphodiesterase [Ilumatobacteraceae bacterium]|nr:diguanylate cyclase/phosphodiesterase [Ilumatobacteraceae bacterium]
MSHRHGQADAPRSLKGRGAATVLIAVYVAFAVWFVSNTAGAALRTEVADLTYPVVGLLVCHQAWRAHVHATAARARSGWALFAAAMAARALADGCWFWVEAVRHQQPFPSIADIGYTASYLLMFVAVWTLGAPRRGLDRRSLALDLATVVAGSFVLVWYLLLDQITSLPTHLLQEVLAVGYPVGDGLLVMASAALLLRRPSWLSPRALALLIGGLIAWAAADVVWTRLSLGDNYTGGDWIDLFWLGAMVCWGLAADTTRRAVEPSTRALPMVRVEQLVPLAGVAMGYGALLTQLDNARFRELGVGILGCLVLGVLLAARQSAVKRDHVALLARYYELATVDALTGLLRREALIEAADRLLVRAQQSGSSVAVLMIDVDRFKQVNDQFGHAAGDAVLMTVSHLCRELRRDSDVVGRFGGDELIAVLPGIDQRAGLVVAGRLIEAVAKRPTMVGGSPVPVTLSIGATDSGGDEPLIAVLARADDALYRAKANGRGVAVGYRQEPVTSGT